VFRRRLVRVVSATGPWGGRRVDQIYQIPISSPAYSATNVRVDSYDDESVVYSVDEAYVGMMVGWGVSMWGTGWYYPPYVGWAGYYPVYYPFYPSYGYGAFYNPWTGAYTRAGVAYGPFGGAGYAARYNPSTGTYARGAAAWGPGGARGARRGTRGQARRRKHARRERFGSGGRPPSSAVIRGPRRGT
jgi:hypothetical protein